MIGETISRYRIIDSLGEGGMGTVYLAEDITLGRQVAIKFLTSTTPEYRARFLREARAVSGLVHSNIATVFDYGETPEGKPFIVMELVRGQPLSEKLEEGSLPLPEAVRIVSAIAAALGEAHHHGVVHRDVKPSNVVITERGQVKVLDFGLVKQIYDEEPADATESRLTLPGTRTRSDVIVGTPLYLSPEQATGKRVDGRSDLFALGAVLYECITGHSAFAGASVIEIGAQVIHVTPAAPSKLNHSIPPELDRITMKALQKDVDARYQSADALIQDLQAVLPNLQADGFRSGGRDTKALVAPTTHSASALRTLTDVVIRPRLSLGTLLLVVLGLALVTWVVVRWWKPAPYTPTPLALDWYNKGNDALQNGAFLQAGRAFEQAIAADNNFPLAHARLAETWFELDYADRAKDEMLKVQSLVPNRSQLARTDALYLEAITATITKDFTGAIEAYKELAALSPDEPRVYVDLGRAYEKNDDIKLAIESYVQATNRGLQYATAFLRVASLYGRQGDQPGATAAFDKADTLYQAAGNFEGQAEVSYQRGFLLIQMGKSAEAQPHLQRALELSRTTANEYQQVKTQLKLGDAQVDTGKEEEGRQTMRDALALAEARGIDNYTKRALIDLGNSFISDGKYEEAQKYFTQSLELAQKQKDPRNSARAWLALASLADRQSKPDEVARLVELALPFYRQGGYRKETMQAFHLLARAKVQRGDYSAALESFSEALKLSQRIGDNSTSFLAHQDIGLLFIRQGRYPEALEQFDEAYKIATAINAKKYRVLSLIDHGNALWRLGRYNEARTFLDQASPIAESPDAAKDVAALYNLARARLALSEGKFADAKAKSRQALALAGERIKTAATTSTYTLGLALTLSGATNEGIRNCDKAVEMAKQAGDPFLLSEALLALAETKLKMGDSAAALQAALESQELFARIDKQDSEWQAWLLAARASLSAGDTQKAQDYASRGENVFSGLQQKWGVDNYNLYLTRPDVQISRKQLSEMIAGKT